MITSSPLNGDTKIRIKGGLLSALLFSLGSGLVGDLSALFALVPLFVCVLRTYEPAVVPPSLPLTDTLKIYGLPFLLSLGLVLLLTKPEQALSYGFYVALPGFGLPLLALQYRHHEGTKVWYPFEKLVTAVGLYTFAYTLILTLIWHLGGLNATALSLLQDSFANKPLEAQAHFNQLLIYLTRIWPYVPGISLSLFVLMVAGATSLSQRWFAKRALPMPRPPLALGALYLPWGFWRAFALFGAGFALSTLATFSPGQALCGNLLAPLLSFFLLQGLAVVMVYAKKQSNPKMFLVIFYGFMLVFGWTSLILILGGLLEPWLDLRSRLIQTKEKE